VTGLESKILILSETGVLTMPEMRDMMRNEFSDSRHWHETAAFSQDDDKRVCNTNNTIIHCTVTINFALNEH